MPRAFHRPPGACCCFQKFGRPRAASALVLVCVLLGGCRTLSRQGPGGQSVATARQLTQQAIAAKDRDDWKRAESLIQRAVQTNPTDPDARRIYAEALWHRQALHDALEQLEESCRLVADDPSLTVRTGELYLALSKIEEASQMAERALQLDPKFAPAWALRGRVSAAHGQPREALADYQRSLGYDPDNREVAILLAEAYRQLNEPQQALVALERLADTYSPGDQPQQVLLLQGLALTALERYDEAVETLSKAASRDRPTPDILSQLAEAQMRSGRVASAQATIGQALALDPNHIASRNLSAKLATAPAAGRAVWR
jgi:tetratricopeptide (TPR) repeat protein